MSCGAHERGFAVSMRRPTDAPRRSSLHSKISYTHNRWPDTADDDKLFRNRRSHYGLLCLTPPTPSYRVSYNTKRVRYIRRAGRRRPPAHPVITPFSSRSATLQATDACYPLRNLTRGRMPIPGSPLSPLPPGFSSGACQILIAIFRTHVSGFAARLRDLLRTP
jgi:hypothetical protein